MVGDSTEHGEIALSHKEEETMQIRTRRQNTMSMYIVSYKTMLELVSMPTGGKRTV